jgi:hypothetical protein
MAPEQPCLPWDLPGLRYSPGDGLLAARSGRLSPRKTKILSFAAFQTLRGQMLAERGASEPGSLTRAWRR